MQALIACGATHLIEVGPGDVLTGLIKRLDRSIDRDAINTVDALDALVESFYSD
jgi:[acyl-carrier-protein] S-malonyltransferase